MGIEDLVFNIGNLRYDILVDFLDIIEESYSGEVKKQIRKARNQIDNVWSKYCINKDNSMHPTEVFGYEERLNDLVEDIVLEKYSSSRTFFENLAYDLRRQGCMDSRRGRKKLATGLLNASAELFRASNYCS